MSVRGPDSLRSMTRYGLGVQCLGCYRRAVVHPDDLPNGDGIRLTDLSFRCTKCRGRKVDLTLFDKDSARRRYMRD